MSTQIKFGTSGWRAIIAEDFTVANVRRAVTGIGRYVASQKSSGARVIVGRDPSYMGERYVQIAVGVLAECVRTLLRSPTGGGDWARATVSIRVEPAQCLNAERA